MPPFGPVRRAELVRTLRVLGFEGPFSRRAAARCLVAVVASMTARPLALVAVCLLSCGRESRDGRAPHEGAAPASGPSSWELLYERG